MLYWSSALYDSYRVPAVRSAPALYILVSRGHVVGKIDRNGGQAVIIADVGTHRRSQQYYNIIVTYLYTYDPV